MLNIFKRFNAKNMKEIAERPMLSWREIKNHIKDSAQRRCEYIDFYDKIEKEQVERLKENGFQVTVFARDLFGKSSTFQRVSW